MGAAVSAVTVGVLDSGCVSTPLAAVDGGALADAGADDAGDPIAPVCAPPLLLMVTPDATWTDEDVVPDVFVVSGAVTPLPVDVDPPLVDVESAPVVAVVEDAVPVVDVAPDPVDDSPDDVLLDVEPAELDVDDPEDVPVVSAAANP